MVDGIAERSLVLSKVFFECYAAIKTDDHRQIAGLERRIQKRHGSRFLIGKYASDTWALVDQYSNRERPLVFLAEALDLFGRLAAGFRQKFLR